MQRMHIHNLNSYKYKIEIRNRQVFGIWQPPTLNLILIFVNIFQTFRPGRGKVSRRLVGNPSFQKCQQTFGKWTTNTNATNDKKINKCGFYPGMKIFWQNWQNWQTIERLENSKKNGASVTIIFDGK